MNKTKIKQLEREIKLLKEYKELLEKCIELKNKLFNPNTYIYNTTYNPDDICIYYSTDETISV